MLRLRWRRVAVPFRNVVANAQSTYRVRESVLIQLETDDGLCGTGEAALPAGSSFAAQGSAIDAFLRSAGSCIEPGHSPQDAAGLALPSYEPGAWSAAVVCGLETAIAGLASREAGIPLYRWLATRTGLAGPGASREIDVNGLVDLTDPAAAARDAAGLAASGFRTLKLKVGGEPRAALRTVAAVREAVGPGVTIRCDANRAWEYSEAIQFLDGCALHGVALCEEPIADPGCDYSMLAALRKSSPVPLAVDESTRTVEALERAISAGAADAVVIKPMASGLNEALRMLACARAADMPVVVTTTFDLAPGTAVALHLAALTGAPALACGLATMDLVEDPLGSGVPAVNGGRMAIPQQAGLGVTLDVSSVERYATGNWSKLEP
jgi:L-alanine-DL-glutamate epimerase-like enolase superfamily enzyme